MRIVRISDLKPGDVLGRALLHDDGRVLLNAGVCLTRQYITSLKAKGYTRVFIRDPDIPVEVEPEEDLDPATRAHALKVLRDAYIRVENEIRRLRTESFEDVAAACSSASMRALTDPEGPLKQIHLVVQQILDEVLERNTLAGLTFIKSEDTALYEHSIDVCVLSLMIGRTIGLPNARMRQLAIGGLLHDIGVLFLKPGIPERVRIQQHTTLGYELLKNSPDPDILAPHVAYEHHEHQDGSGQPRGLVGSNQIERNRELPPPIPTLIGEIAAAANLYNNLVRGTASEPAVTPDTALRAVCRAAGTALNREVVTAFVRVVPVFPVGIEVLVRGKPYDGYTGIVTEVSRGSLDRPVVALYRDADGNTIDPVYVNTASERQLLLRGKMM